MTTRRSALALALAAVTLVSSSAWAQDEPATAFPSRPIKIVVPFGSGGTNDVLARLVATHLADTLKQPVVVENRTGAGGDIGLAAVAKSRADGYTLLMASNAATISAATKKKPPVNVVTELKPITLIGSQPLLLATSPSSQINSLQQLFAQGKSNPNISYGTPGVGTPHHLSFEMIGVSQGMKMIHVPFNGAPPSLNETMAGRVTLVLATPSTAGPLVQQGRLKVLGVLSKNRLKEYPDAPTMREAGIAGLDEGVWYGLMAPAGMTPALADKLQSTMATILKQPALTQRIHGMDVDLLELHGNAFSDYVAADYGKWKNVASKATLTLE